MAGRRRPYAGVSKGRRPLVGFKGQRPLRRSLGPGPVVEAFQVLGVPEDGAADDRALHVGIAQGVADGHDRRGDEAEDARGAAPQPA